MTYRRKDSYYRRARAAGLRARSAYKLAELDARFRLLRPGDFVVDLGAWPGGWLQVALEGVGTQGLVVGVDLVAVDPLPAANLRLVSGDVRQPATWRAVLDLLGRPADVVLSDLAPKLSGVRDRDDARSGELVTAVLEMLPALLRPGGHLLVKLFTGAVFDAAAVELRGRFEEFRATRPGATRSASDEIYGVGRGYRGPAS
jgi:23S rRNA (uridine2552-2'-O)-methyltransferase